MNIIRLLLVAVVLVSSAVSAPGVAAQEVNTEIQFEDEVVVGEETTITYVATVVSTPVETDVEIDLTLSVDGEEVESLTKEEQISDGTELRTEFTHTFESPGEKQVRVDAVTRVLGNELERTTTATVEVSPAVEDDGDEGDTNVTDDTTEGNNGEGEETDEMEGEDGEEDDTATDGSENAEETDETEDTDSEGGDDTESSEDDGGGGGEGMPGFTALVALASVVAAAVYTRSRG